MVDVPGWLAALAVVAPSLSAVGAYRLAGLSDEGRDERIAKREERARLIAREDRLEDERRVFQRAVLLDLQDRVLAVTRTATEAILQDRRRLKQSGQMPVLPEDLRRMSYSADIALLPIRERVLSDELRPELKGLQELATAIVLFQPVDMDSEKAIAQLDGASAELARRHTRVNEILGRELRAVLGDEEPSSA
jgi:hypothetical protein